MKLHNNAFIYRVFGCAACALLLVACGGSDNDSSGAAAAGGNGTEIPEINPDTTQLINALNARNLAIDLLEVVDITRYLAVDLPAAVAGLATGNQPCAGVGSASVTNGNEQINVTFSNCQVAADSPAILSGDMSISIVAGDVGGVEHVLSMTYSSAFSFTHGRNSVSADGQLGVSSTAGSKAMSSEALLLSDSQGVISLTMLDSLETQTGAGTVTSAIALKASLSRFGIEVVVATPSGLTGNSVACPATGTLTVTATDGSVVSVEGGAGDNVLIGHVGNVDTVNCAEIDTAAGAGGRNIVLVPPMAPGF